METAGLKKDELQNTSESPLVVDYMFVHERERQQHLSPVSREHLTIRRDHFVDDKVGLFEIEHDVQFADILEILVHSLDQVVNELENTQLVAILHMDAHDKVQRRVPSVHNTDS